jgi:trimethylamine--corrinoid protein Co-methyltransferase
VEAAEPGVPFIYAPVLATMDPRTGRYAGGAVEAAAMSVAGTEMARHYGLPVEASGSATDHFVPCLQAAYEKAETALLATLAWPDILVGPGQLGGATVLSLEQLVMDVEMFRMARQAHEGVPVADDLWLDDVLDKVGPCGSFLFDASTRRNVRGGEWYVSDFGLHDSFEHWQAAGSPSTLEAARARVDELLAGHRPLPLHDDVIRELKELEKSAASR